MGAFITILLNMEIVLIMKLKFMITIKLFQITHTHLRQKALEDSQMFGEGLYLNLKKKKSKFIRP